MGKYPLRQQVVPVAGVPTQAQMVEIVEYADDAVVCAEINVGAATGVTHTLYGQLRTATAQPQIIAQYNNLETITTRGKYAHDISNAGMKYDFIGIGFTVAVGAIVSQEAYMSYK